ncbi:hypothetical protein BaRGS_00013530, partial [Batillaria attramentaria]
FLGRPGFQASRTAQLPSGLLLPTSGQFLHQYRAPAVAKKRAPETDVIKRYRKLATLGQSSQVSGRTGASLVPYPSILLPVARVPFKTWKRVIKLSGDTPPPFKNTQAMELNGCGVIPRLLSDLFHLLNSYRSQSVAKQSQTQNSFFPG